MERVYSDLLYTGTSGLQLPIPKYLFPSPYENSSRLSYYSTLFNSIEINSSFYQIPKPAIVAKWANDATKDFRFTFKLWKGITHIKNFEFKEAEVATFFNVIAPVYDKKGCVLIQLPPSVGMEYLAKLEKLLNCVKVTDSLQWNIAVEFRNKSWYNAFTYSLLKKFKATLIVHDFTKSATPMIDHESDFMYLRFHGPSGNYRESYSDEFLREQAIYIKRCVAEGKRVYVYFNNTMGDALNNLKVLNDLFQGKKNVI